MSFQPITSASVRATNRQRIFDLIYERKAIAKQSLARELQLSTPTVTQNLLELQDANLIYKNGQDLSTGGRKAQLYSIQENARVSLGLQIRPDYFRITAVNLNGNIIRQEKHELVFRNTEQVCGEICAQVTDFMEAIPIPADRILELGIVLPALISHDGNRTVYSKVMSENINDWQEMNVASFQSHFTFPCKFYHDAKAVALNELWARPEITDALFFNIHENLSSALIIDRKFHKYKDFESGLFEHMVLVTGGKRCYCGKNGCMNMYCSLQGLLNHNESFEEFAEKKQNGDPATLQRWSSFLQHLAMGIDNMRMVVGSDVILGGYVSELITDEDLATLHQYINSISSFPTEQDFVFRARSIDASVARGGALPSILNFIKNLPDFETIY